MIKETLSQLFPMPTHIHNLPVITPFYEFLSQYCYFSVETPFCKGRFFPRNIVEFRITFLHKNVNSGNIEIPRQPSNSY